jgi:hypothetical protein
MKDMHTSETRIIPIKIVNGFLHCLPQLEVNYGSALKTSLFNL